MIKLNNNKGGRKMTVKEVNAMLDRCGIDKTKVYIKGLQEKINEKEREDKINKE